MPNSLSLTTFAAVSGCLRRYADHFACSRANLFVDSSRLARRARETRAIAGQLRSHAIPSAHRASAFDLQTLLDSRRMSFCLNGVTI